MKYGSHIFGPLSRSRVDPTFGGPNADAQFWDLFDANKPDANGAPSKIGRYTYVSDAYEAAAKLVDVTVQ